MLRKFSIIFILLLTATTLFAETTFIGYGTYIYYLDDPEKSDGLSITNYISSGNLIHDFEFGVNYTRIRLLSPVTIQSRNIEVTSYNIWNFTESYTNWGGWIKNLAFRAGFHYMSSEEDDFSDRGKIIFTDLTYFIPYKFYLGSEEVLSLYKTPEGDVQVLQISPHLNIRLFFSIPYGSLYLGIRGYGIFINNYQFVDLKKFSHYSVEGWLNYNFKDISITWTLWNGDQVFAVKNGGFVVYNLADNFTGGTSVTLNYRSPGGTILGITGEYNKYNSLKYSNNKSLDQLVVTGYLGISF